MYVHSLHIQHNVHNYNESCVTFLTYHYFMRFSHTAARSNNASQLSKCARFFFYDYPFIFFLVEIIFIHFVFTIIIIFF